MRSDERDPVTTRARSGSTAREPISRDEGLTALDQDLAGTMAFEGGRSAQAVEAPLTAPDVSLLRRRRRALYVAAALGAVAGVLLVIGTRQVRVGRTARASWAND